MKSTPICFNLFLASLALLALENKAQAWESKLWPTDVGAFGLGRPGFSSEFGMMNGAEAAGQGGLESRWARLNAPLHKWDLPQGGLLAAGVTYSMQDLDWAAEAEEPEAFDWSGSMHTAGLQLSYVRSPEKEGFMCIAQAGLNMGGISGEFGSHNVNFSLLGVAGYRFSEELVIGLAGYSRWEAGELTAYPGIGVIWRPHEDWLLWLSPPAPSITYRFAEGWRLGAAVWPSGGRWDLDQQESGVAEVDYTTFRAGISLEHDLTKNLTIGLRGGLDLNEELVLRDAGGGALLEADLEDGWFLALGVSWGF